MKQVNTIIVGQGIAGSLAAFMLYRLNTSFIVIDAAHTTTASKIAAGMFTPISGKRNTINSLMIDQIPFAIAIYKEIEKLTGEKIIYTENVYYVLESTLQKDVFIDKCKKDAYKNYIIPGAEYLPGIKQEYGLVEITNSGWVDCPLFINCFNDWLKQRSSIIQEVFDYDELHVDDKTINYKNISARNIIFCEGYRAANNPFFTAETIIPCKGDILTLEYGEALISHIIKKSSCYIIPAGSNKFKAGSTYQWNNNTEELEEANKKEIETKLNSILEREYKITNHQTAIRPTTLNRDVIAKQHPLYPNLYQLNGLGTKGVIQGPWWADHITRLMISNVEK